MRITRYFIPGVLTFFLFQTANAQKFGHVNSAQLVQNHPGIPAANAALDAYRKSLSDPFEAKTKAFQSKYQFYMEEMQAGTLSKVSAQTRQEDLQKEQDALNQEGQQIQNSILQKRSEVLQPILVEVDSVITLIGKEGKYTMIFDDSANGALLYAPDADDLTETVKARIGGK
jgi:outer membrane protein